MDQACECMREHQAETNPGRDERGKKKRKSHKKWEAKKKKKKNWASVLLSWVIILGERRSAGSSLCSEASVACQKNGWIWPQRQSRDGWRCLRLEKTLKVHLAFIQSNICCLHWGLSNSFSDSAEPNIIKYRFMHLWTRCWLSGEYWRWSS